MKATVIAVKSDLIWIYTNPLRHVFTCPCSMCSKKGYLWVFPEESQFRITIGQQAMAKYSVDGLSGDHYFCPTCGTVNMAQNHMIEKGGPSIAVNISSLT
ncbi:Mss4-like protein [Penicillium malachiteum]|uniref:Mss4-like protein n=1 Tax=Penicillium malachiteum TaxID=1324776 RepID=UPI0025467879|nr:Mss4-like protein [Penicillium malachiteum]KAJ5726624.1 Mss4-like protein [Penicillium malachiteum]